MTKFAYAGDVVTVYKASTKRLAEPFIPEMQEVFKSLELLLSKAVVPAGDVGPSAATVNWAKEVLLRVLPRKFLIGAGIEAFQREIHATWESDAKGKRVVVFFPGPQELKIYHELVKNDAVVEHKLVNATSPMDISQRLGWFFQ